MQDVFRVGSALWLVSTSFVGRAAKIGAGLFAHSKPGATVPNSAQRIHPKLPDLRSGSSNSAGACGLQCGQQRIPIPLPQVIDPERGVLEYYTGKQPGALCKLGSSPCSLKSIAGQCFEIFCGLL